MRDRRVVWTAVLLLVAVMILGVGIQAGAKTKISFWHDYSGEAEEALLRMIDDFERINANIEVEASRVADMYAKLPISIAGGAPPDVVYFSRDYFTEWAARNSFMDLSDLMERDRVEFADYFEQSWTQTIYRGKAYGIPLTADLLGILYWNKGLFKEAGLDPNRPPKTWDELVAFSDKLTVKNGERLERVGYAPTYGRMWFHNYLWQNGGDVVTSDLQTITLNSPEAVQTLEWIVGFVERYGLRGLTGLNEIASQAYDPFIGGQYAMWDNSTPYAVRGLKYYAPEGFEWGVTIAPYNKVPVTQMRGSNLVIPNGAKHPQEAWEFIKFATSNKAVYLTEAVGYTMANINANKAPHLQDLISLRLLVEYAQYAKTYPPLPISSFLETETKRAVERAMFGQVTPKQALDELTRKAQAELNRFKESSN